MIHEHDKQLGLWIDIFKDMKQGIIEGMAKHKLLESENKVLKEQYGEDEDVLILSPNAKALLLETLAQRLGATWGKALVAMSEMRESTLRERREGQLVPYTAIEQSKEASYWKQEAAKYKEKV